MTEEEAPSTVTEEKAPRTKGELFSYLSRAPGMAVNRYAMRKTILPKCSLAAIMRWASAAFAIGTAR